jgi:uncharacterized protein YbaP (TraB family)
MRIPNWNWVMMKFIRKYLVLPAALFAGTAAWADAAAPDCRPIRMQDVEYSGPREYDRGLLWKVERSGLEPSWVFGTIHVADDEITEIPGPVAVALRDSRTFVMEALPDPEQVIALSSLMFFDDGRRLTGMLPKPLYDRAVEILASYHLPGEAVAIMKPWAAYLTMNYPADMRMILDLVLFQTAVAQGSDVHGLETLQEQGNVFNEMAIEDQLRVLVDTLCHYDLVGETFEKMKQLYLKRDLKGMYRFGQRLGFDDNRVYEALTTRLLDDRNRLMTERLLPLLEREGSAFIAIGAMHLPGRHGVLALLAREGFRVSRVY